MKLQNKLKIILIIILISINHFFILYPDDGHFSYNLKSGTVFPIKNNEIKMVKEEVYFYSDNDFSTANNGKFETIFYFENTTNKNQEVLVGFPIDGNIKEILTNNRFNKDWENEVNIYNSEYNNFNDNEKDEFNKQVIEKYYKFRSYINDIEIKRDLFKLTDEYKNDDYNYVYLTEISFFPFEVKKLVNIYYQSAVGGFSFLMDGNREIKYILKTGSYWQGNIEDVKIKFYLTKQLIKDLEKNIIKINFQNEDEFNFYNISFDGVFRDIKKSHLKCVPSPTKIDVNSENFVIEWNYTNLEPDFNISCLWELDYPELFSLNNLLNLIVFDDIMPLNKGLNRDKERVYSELSDKEYLFKLCIGLSDFLLNKYTNKNMNYSYNELVKFKKYYDFINYSNKAIFGDKIDNEKWVDFFSNLSWYNNQSEKNSFNQEELNILIKKLNKIYPEKLLSKSFEEYKIDFEEENAYIDNAKKAYKEGTKFYKNKEYKKTIEKINITFDALGKMKGFNVELYRNKNVLKESEIENAYYIRGDSYFKTKDFEKAINDYSRVIDIKIENQGSIEMLSYNDANIMRGLYNQRGISYLRKLKINNAIDDLTYAYNIININHKLKGFINSYHSESENIKNEYKFKTISTYNRIIKLNIFFAYLIKYSWLILLIIISVIISIFFILKTRKDKKIKTISKDS